MDAKRKSYTPEFKLKVVLESMQRDTTQEEVCKKFGISSSMLHRWRKEFQTYAASVFYDKRDPKQKAQSQGYEPGESPDDLKMIIGELTVQNEILKKASGLMRKLQRHRRWNWHTSCVGLTAPTPKARWRERWAWHEEHSISKESKPQKINR
jgi:transposase